MDATTDSVIGLLLHLITVKTWTVAALNGHDQRIDDPAHRNCFFKAITANLDFVSHDPLLGYINTDSFRESVKHK